MPDIQQARHLGAQSGWYIKAGSRGDAGVKKDCYKLICTSRYEKVAVHDLYIGLGFLDHGKEFRLNF